MIVRLPDKALQTIFFLAAWGSALTTLSIFWFLLILGLPLLTGGRFFEILFQPWAPHLGQFGIQPMIAGTMAITFLTMLFALPLSLGCAALVNTAPSRRFSRLLRKLVQMMTGIPTVIYGFVGIFLLVPLVRELSNTGSGMCVLTAALLLALLVSPTMILFFCDSFERVPRSYGDAVLALGGNNTQKFLYVTLPHAWCGIATGTIMAMCRALGDTMIALMIAGNAVQVPASPLDSARTLTSHIALVFAADYQSMEFKAIFACGLFLYLFSTLLVTTFRLLEKQRGRRSC